MSVIENFASISVQEQKEFANKLVAKINSEKTFIDDLPFEVDGVEADELTGELRIDLSHQGTLDVRRFASWSCADRDEASYTPDDPEFDNYLDDDVRKTFKTLSTEIDGYTVSLTVDDADVEETIEVEVDNAWDDDSGIGSYEFWGEVGYDSHPYCAVEGTLVQACTIYLSLYVEATTVIPEDTEED